MMHGQKNIRLFTYVKLSCKKMSYRSG